MKVNEIIASPETAATLIADQADEIKELRQRIRDLERQRNDLSWDNEFLRTTYEEKSRYDGY